ncbi:hypothetical protein SAMN04489761_2405 [Tenacibaculum sp. MAR_2009_124]|uniref:hypothetical protein n=1 Tax=Tenacibaculum sp. MAR_2009_124 TaxID=1250059 RepID=UPI00089A3EA0|nr:hypothetical protein [Tenacibaculum sp. MAR_2009_124]SEC21868.1 hypothetical protein SAMN04489761_2405 [Tenacibaculum sp. MAR_2009_124]
MKRTSLLFSFISTVFFLVLFLNSCQRNSKAKHSTESPAIIGTWKLLTGTIIKEKDTTVTDYTANQEVIKIINNTHFAFLRHDLKQDSTAIFVSGGGRCEITSQRYIEHLDFCNFREWENNKFEFEYRLYGDTLITKGIEKVTSINVNHLNIEKYIRLQ